MDSTTSTADLDVSVKMNHEHLLLEIIKELCSGNSKEISSELQGKVNRMIADYSLTHYASLHKINTAVESTSTLLGLMQKTTTELTYNEQIELNQAVIKAIQTKLPILTSELEKLKICIPNGKKQEKIKELQESLEEKLNTLKKQENEKVELMMEWLNHRVQDIVKFNDNSTELLTLKTKILDLKSRILHMHILQNIFTETNQSIKAYSEIQKDLKESIKETEQRIKKCKEIIQSDMK